MKIDTEMPGNNEAVLTIEPDPEELEDFVKMAFRDLADRVKIAGFRKGKVPRPLLERYVGKSAVMEEAISKALPQFYAAALEQTKFEPVAQPKIEVLNLQPLTFRATIPLRPSVDLKDYKSIRLPPEPVNFKPEQVDEVIERLRNQHSSWDAVDRPLQYGDMVKVHLQAASEAEEFKDYRNQEYLVVQDSPVPVPGFSAQLVGMAKGETREFEIFQPAPQETKQDAKAEAEQEAAAEPAAEAKAEPQGVHYRFKVELVELKQRRLPELDDDFARKVDAALPGLEALRERTASNLKYMAEAQAKQALEEKAADALLERAEIEYSPLLVERDIDRYLTEQGAKFGEGEAGIKQYLENIGKTEADIRDKVRPLAAKAIERALVLKRLAEEEGIAVTAEDVDQEIARIIEGAAPDRKAELEKLLAEQQGHDMIQQNLLMEKTKECLVAIVSGPPVEGAAPEAASQAAEKSEEGGKESGDA